MPELSLAAWHSPGSVPMVIAVAFLVYPVCSYCGIAVTFPERSQAKIVIPGLGVVENASNDRIQGTEAGGVPQV